MSVAVVQAVENIAGLLLFQERLHHHIKVYIVVKEDGEQEGAQWEAWGGGGEERGGGGEGRGRGGEGEGYGRGRDMGRGGEGEGEGEGRGGGGVWDGGDHYTLHNNFSVR